MPLLCNTNSLLATAACYLCLPDHELLAAKVRLREQLRVDADGGTVRNITDLLAASVAWRQLSPHQRLAIELAQIDNEAVAAGARPALMNASRAEIACYCAPETELRAIIAMLECVDRQTP